MFRPIAFILFLGAGCFAAVPATALAGGVASTPAPHVLVARHFADLNAHRLYAAWRLEAPCGVSLTVSNGPGAPAGSASYAGRGAWVLPHGPLARHPVLASARVKRITRLHIPILDRNHILAFGVAGWFRFDYRGVTFANDRHRSGWHVIKIAVWKCNGRWGVEPTYWEFASGGELNWN